MAAPGRKFSSKEMETISRGLTKKMLEFVADDERLESALANWESLRGEADVKLQQLSGINETGVISNGRRKKR